MQARGTLHLLIGPVGAGKTTYAQQRIARSPAVLLDLDVWMVRLFGADPRPADGVMQWYLERRERCRGLLWALALQVLDCGTSVFLELGLLQRQEREACYAKARAEDIELRVYLIDAPREVRRERVLRRNENPGPFTQVVPPEFFDRASDAWEAPSQAEKTTWSIIDV